MPFGWPPWTLRCSLMCCSCPCFADEEKRILVADVAKLVGSVLDSDAGLSASDIIFGLMHLHQESKCVPSLVEQPVVTVQPSSSAVSDNRPEWMTVTNARLYVKYAVGAYGWLGMDCADCVKLIERCCRCFLCLRYVIAAVVCSFLHVFLFLFFLPKFPTCCGSFR